jgi:transposase
MELIKQNVGMEVDSKKVKVSFQIMRQDWSTKVVGSRTFNNGPQGFKALKNWIDKKRKTEKEVHLTMEATGVYYERLAYYFQARGAYVIHVLLPNISKGYRQSLNLKSKTDEIDAGMLAQLGLERQLSRWEPMSEQMRALKKLNRHRLQLVKDKTMVFNQLHAEQASNKPSKKGVNRYEKHIQFIENQIQEIERELKQKVKEDGELSQRIENVCTAKGLGFTTVCGVVAELNGFALFKNRNQVVSYAGYDVVKNESGTSVKGPTKISKKGNSYVRQMMFMAAMTAAVHDEHHKAYYQRIVDKTKIKMKANVAIQRKLLLLIYALFTKNEPYDPTYHLKLQKRLEPKKGRNKVIQQGVLID